MGFCVFEVCCGVYVPSLGTMRGKFVPEEVRSTIMNIFRIGLNLIVVLVLWNVRGRGAFFSRLARGWAVSSKPRPPLGDCHEVDFLWY